MWAMLTRPGFETLLINGVTAHLGTGTNLSGFLTYQDLTRYWVEYPVEQSNNCVEEISCGPEAYPEEGLKRLGVDTFFDPRGSGAHGCGYRIRDCGAAEGRSAAPRTWMGLRRMYRCSSRLDHRPRTQPSDTLSWICRPHYGRGGRGGPDVEVPQQDWCLAVMAWCFDVFVAAGCCACN